MWVKGSWLTAAQTDQTHHPHGFVTQPLGTRLGSDQQAAIIWPRWRHRHSTGWITEAAENNHRWGITEQLKSPGGTFRPLQCVCDLPEQFGEGRKSRVMFEAGHWNKEVQLLTVLHTYKTFSHWLKKLLVCGPIAATNPFFFKRFVKN